MELDFSPYFILLWYSSSIVLRTKKKVWKCLLDYFPFSVFKRDTSMIFSNFLAISYIRLTDIWVEFRLLVFQKLLWRLFDDIQRPYFILDQKEESRVALENRCYGDIYSKAMPILVVIQQAKPYKGIRRDLYLVNFQDDKMQVYWAINFFEGIFQRFVYFLGAPILLDTFFNFFFSMNHYLYLFQPNLCRNNLLRARDRNILHL